MYKTGGRTQVKTREKRKSKERESGTGPRGSPREEGVRSENRIPTEIR